MRNRNIKCLSAMALATACALGGGGVANAYNSDDGKTEVHGFVENVTFARRDVGLSKFRNTAQLEVDNDLGGGGLFSSLSFHFILRATYDAVYDLNSDEYGDKAGGPILLESPGGRGFAPHGDGDITGGTLDGPLPGNQFGFDTGINPNAGLIVLGSPLHETQGGVAFGVPVRPCNVDSRGCIPGYLNFSANDLRFPEFNKRLDFVRELYFDAVVPLNNGREIDIRLGKQQVVWGRTDLFRVLDVINPVDFSRNNIYDELEDIRIPLWMLQVEYRLGATETFDDLNFSLVWNFDKFRPAMIGQAGTPNVILDAGSFFRGMKNCWDNGCTVANFANGTIATDFGPGQIGIRQANLRNWSLNNTQIGGKIEGVFKAVGFSLNYLSYISQLPALRGGIPATNTFTGEQGVWPYLIAFDIDFPRINLFGGSLDYYMDSIKSVWRIEGAYTTGEQFANTLRPDLFSESDVFRYVIGLDRDFFVPFLNRTKAFLFSAQLFGQHILDHELEESAGSALGIPGFTKAGIPDWKNTWIGTLLIKGWWMQNRLSPQIIFAYDFKAEAAAIAPSVDWLISDSWRLVMGANVKVGTGARRFDDCRSCNPFPPFTATPLHGDPFQPGSVGLGGFEPLGRFRAGPLGMAQKEDEIQISIRYRF